TSFIPAVRRGADWAWDWQSAGGSSRNTAEGSTSRANRGAARRLRSACRKPRKNQGGRANRRAATVPAAGNPHAQTSNAMNADDVNSLATTTTADRRPARSAGGLLSFNLRTLLLLIVIV